MKNNDLDKFVKGKLDEQKFEYNPADWDDALKLIQKQDDNNRPLWIWWAAAGLALLLTASIAITSTRDSVKEQITERNTEIQFDTNKSAKDNITKESAPVINDPKNQTINKEVQIEEALVSQVDISTTTDGSDIIAVQKEVVPKTSSRTTENINLPDPISGNIPELKPISSPVSESVADERAGEDFSSSKDEKLVQANEKVDKSSQDAALTISDQPQMPVQNTVSELSRNKEVYDRASTLLLVDLNRIGAPHYAPGLYSWETPVLPQKIKPLLENEVKLGFGWGVSAYVNPYVANVDGQSKEITGFTGGLTSMYRLDRTLSINADLLYTYRTGTFDKSQVSETRRYSFEALDGISSLNPKDLHYIGLPVYVGFHFGQHKISLGGSLNYLSAVRGDVFDQTIDSNGQVIDESSTAGWIEKTGFTSLNPGALLGYDFHISNRWMISFRSNYMFKSLIDSAVAEEINSFIIKENSQVNLQIGSTYYFR